MNKLFKHKTFQSLENYGEFNITGQRHGIITFARNLRSAKRLFRRSYPSEKIFYAKLAGKLRASKWEINQFLKK